MKSNIIKEDGKEIDLKTLTDEELMELHTEVRAKEKMYKKKIKKYEEKYPFLTIDEK